MPYTTCAAGLTRAIAANRPWPSPGNTASEERLKQPSDRAAHRMKPCRNGIYIPIRRLHIPSASNKAVPYTAGIPAGLDLERHSAMSHRRAFSRWATRCTSSDFLPPASPTGLSKGKGVPASSPLGRKSHSSHFGWPFLISRGLSADEQS